MHILRSRVLIAAAAVACAAVATVLVVVSSKSDASAPRALTADEANRLAITRFRNYETGGRAVRITVPDTAGGLTVTASVDFRSKRAYGELRGAGRNSSSDGVIRWTPTQLSAASKTVGWTNRPLQTTGSTLDTALRITLGLASDRPDNAQLLPQNGARQLGQETINGHRTDVMLGPAARDRPDTEGTVKYWIAEDGTMYRVQLAVASEPQPVVIDFDTQPYTPPK
ncbi:hypothetical protein ACFV9C_09190 [Kribbella sp. NPDC059898]|uniref:hypothetical protein n=1 Tax=Kribbella sp. NPDC059898 TaxID=3346995 RepID=UPI0036551512